jgi:rubrerythrin
MDAEYEKTLDAVKFSIQMEIEGKAYYEDAARKISNTAGKQLFQWLAGQEENHRTRFEQIYKSIGEKKDWPVVKFEPDPTSRARKVFLDAVKNLKSSIEGSKGELDIISGAMELEDKTRLFYERRGKEAGQEVERQFYQSIAAEEQGHFVTLADYREYIIDPSGYFIKHERHSLDGA